MTYEGSPRRIPTESIEIPSTLEKKIKYQNTWQTISLINQTAVCSIFHHPIKWVWSKLVSIWASCYFCSHYIHDVLHTPALEPYQIELKKKGRKKKKRWPSWCLSPGSFMKPFLSAKQYRVGSISQSEAFRCTLNRTLQNLQIDQNINWNWIIKCIKSRNKTSTKEDRDKKKHQRR